MLRTPNAAPADRVFDNVADRFERKVYGGLKGKIRLAVLQRDLSFALDALPQKPLRVLDVGAGSGHMALFLAALGHDCTLCEPSEKMLAFAKKQAADRNLRARFLHAAYQDLPLLDRKGDYDAILCHAALEWVADPKALLATIDGRLRKGGILSLCFYNPKAIVYRNLIVGNFRHLAHPKSPDAGSLTPKTPVEYDTVKAWLGGYGYGVLRESGVRVFYDYTTTKRGGLAHDDDVIAMEMRYSTEMPFRLMGRYLHIVAQKPR